jgi:hypothetical protein
MYIKYLPTAPSYSVGMLENGRKYNVKRIQVALKKKEKRKKKNNTRKEVFTPISSTLLLSMHE